MLRFLVQCAQADGIEIARESLCQALWIQLTRGRNARQVLMPFSRCTVDEELQARARRQCITAGDQALKIELRGRRRKAFGSPRMATASGTMW